MSQKLTVGHLLEKASGRSPAGFAMALHISFTAPKYLFQKYNRDWIDLYSRNGFVMLDPTVRWGMANSGAIRWGALKAQDEAGVLDQAAKHGMTYGFTVSLVENGSRSIASFARSDREFTDAEISAIEAIFKSLHAETQGLEALSPADHELLKRLSIFLTHG